ncbi:MAG: SRPBCC family protein [Myxococcota bacterium]|nr:SRPBCC family protein [Myxococcota bacterium]
MTQHSVLHATFTIERDYSAAPARVFASFANPVTKRRWFAGGESFEVKEFTMDFRVGGRESTRLLFQGGPEGAPPKGTEIRNDTTYQDIVAERRIVFAYTMTIGDKRISASLATVELSSATKGTHLVFTEQGAFFEGADDPKMREGGWRDLLSKLDSELRKAA